jgi:hypothetical protein
LRRLQLELHSPDWCSRSVYPTSVEVTAETYTWNEVAFEHPEVLEEEVEVVVDGEVILEMVNQMPVAGVEERGQRRRISWT